MPDDTYSPAEVLAMDLHEIGKHMSGGYGPAKALKLYRASQANAQIASRKPQAAVREVAQ
jgi:hypothetical protein